MGILEDVMKTLERIPVWKRLQGLPAEVSALEARVKALEAKAGPAKGKQCPSCGEPAYRITKSNPAPEPWGRMGAMEDHYLCGSCNYENKIQRNPGQ